MKVALAQFSPVYLNKTKTVKKVCEIISQAGKEKVNLLVFPEAFISGYPDWVWLVPNGKGPLLNDLYRTLWENAITQDDEALSVICKAAKAAKVNVVLGVNEKNTDLSGGSLYNAAFVISKDGKFLGSHRKLIPTGGERTVWGRGDGDTLHSFSLDAVKIGPLICWENYMPLARMHLFLEGVQILVAPTWDKSPNWLQTMQHNAREGGVFVLSCCMFFSKNDIPDSLGFKELYPPEREIINPGNSCIVSPKGKLLAGPVEGKEELIIAQLDLNEIPESKRMFDVAGHYHRPDVFDFKINKPT